MDAWEDYSCFVDDTVKLIVRLLDNEIFGEILGLGQISKKSLP